MAARSLHLSSKHHGPYEIVWLTEDSATLELLFQFMYPQHPPELKNVDFVTVMSLAEAAEKYEVFFCNFCM